MLSPEGLKTFVFAHWNSFPNILTRGSGYETVYDQYGRRTNKVHGEKGWNDNPEIPSKQQKSTLRDKKNARRANTYNGDTLNSFQKP